VLLTATARKEKRIGTVENVENAHAKKLDKSMRLCERKGGQTSLGIQGKNLVETSAAVHWTLQVSSLSEIHGTHLDFQRLGGICPVVNSETNSSSQMDRTTVKHGETIRG